VNAESGLSTVTDLDSMSATEEGAMTEKAPGCEQGSESGTRREDGRSYSRSSVRSSRRRTPVRCESSGSDNEGEVESDIEECDPSPRELMKLFHGLLVGLKKESSMSSEGVVDTKSMVSNLLSHKDGMELSKYIRRVEVDLKQLGVSKKLYKTVLLAKLSAKVKDQVVDLVESSDCSYSQLKSASVETVWFSVRDLKIKLFCDLGVI